MIRPMRRSSKLQNLLYSDRAEALVWPSGVFLFICVAVVRSAFASSPAIDLALTGLQFIAPLVLVLYYLFSPQRTPLRKVDRFFAWSLTFGVLAALLSVPLSVNWVYSTQQLMIYALMIGFLLLTWSRRWTSAVKVRRDLAFVFALGCGMQVVGLLGFIIGAEWAVGDYERLTGVFSNANFAGMAAAVLAPLALFLSNVQRRYETTLPTKLFGRVSPQILIWAGFAASAASLILSQSRGAALAALAGCALALILWVRRLWFTLALTFATVLGGAVVFLMIVTLRSGSFGISQDTGAIDPSSGRFDIYEQLLGAWSASPILGIGYRGSPYLADGLEAHNVYLSVLVEMGIVGGISLLCLAGALIAAGRFSGSAGVLLGAVVAIAVSELTESSLFGWGSPVSITAWLVLTAFAALGRYPDDAIAKETPEPTQIATTVPG